MLVTDSDRLQADVVAIVDRHHRDRSALLTILEEIQHCQRAVTPFAQQVVADLLHLSPSQVASVVSFYGFLETQPRGRVVIRLCRTISCQMQGTQRIARQLENDFGIGFGETTPDGAVSLGWAHCLGMCDRGPAMLVDDHLYTEVTPEQVHTIVADARRAAGLPIH